MDDSGRRETARRRSSTGGRGHPLSPVNHPLPTPFSLDSAGVIHYHAACFGKRIHQVSGSVRSGSANPARFGRKQR